MRLLMAPIITACMFMGAAPTAATARAQSVSCFDAIPDTALKPVMVSIAASVNPSVPPIVGSSADFLAEGAAQQIRVLLGGSVDTVPLGEPRITWRGLSPVRVTAYRDRSIRVHDTDENDRDTTADQKRDRIHPERQLGTGRLLLIEALKRVSEQGNVLFAWPDSGGLDSVAFDLVYLRPTVTPPDSVIPHKHPRYQFPVFSLRVPWETFAVARKQYHPSYPSIDGRRFRANLLLQFVIDTTGHADPSTITNKDPPQLTPSLKRAYQRFVDAATDGIKRTVYEPATIGGCKVRVLVTQPYAFDIGS